MKTTKSQLAASATATHTTGSDCPTPAIDNNRLAGSVAEAEQRRAMFLSAIPPELSRREDAIARNLALENAAPRSKLRKIYQLIDEFSNLSTPFVACTKGCSSCCHMNVAIWKVEADYIGMHTGRSPARVVTTRGPRLEEFIGKPCPFLSQDTCTIYEFRPYVCRKHVSFDTTPYWCEPSRALCVELPLAGFSEIDVALGTLTGKPSLDIFADIRDFFPGQPGTA